MQQWLVSIILIYPVQASKEVPPLSSNILNLAPHSRIVESTHLVLNSINEVKVLLQGGFIHINESV